MVKGLFLALSACFIWGFIFVLPIFLQGFSPIEVALGRYFFYGIISLLFFSFICFKRLISFPLAIWLKALWFALIANILYYTTIVFAVHHSSAGMVTLITGVAPLSIAFYGNWLKNECGFSKLIIPTILIIVGLLTVNLDVFIDAHVVHYSLEYIFGIICAVISLVCWTWYVVANTNFLRANADIGYFEWSTLLGVATFFWVIIGGVFYYFSLEDGPNQKLFLINTELRTFLLVTAILGCICSWFGSFLWNSGCTYLPLSLSGQLTIFESIFGLMFVYLIEKRFPTFFECVGISFMLAAILYSVSLFKQKNEDLIQV